jgi:transposase InsO family protein
VIQQAVNAGARLSKACEELGISVRTIQRWNQAPDSIREDGRIFAERPAPANKLTEDEHQQILEACNEKRFQNLPPSQIVPTLLDEGRYIASVSSFYRVLREHGQLTSRGRAQKTSRRKPTSYAATGPNQVWSWDITYLPTPVRGMHFYLYMVEDIFSRMIVAWEIHTVESADYAAELIQKACLKHGIHTQDTPLVLHSDNGSPMKGATMLATLQRLGVVPSFSRPRVSDDNPYSESLFRTMKYRPNYPSKPFETLMDARTWVNRFVSWYNEEHKHSGLKFVTPAERHFGKAEAIQQERTIRLLKARAQNPERWGSRNIRNWSLPREVWLNPEKSSSRPCATKMAA